VLEFFSVSLEAEQAFFWREQTSKGTADRDGEGGKQKFLALHKTSLEEFVIHKKKHTSLKFSEAICFENGYMFLKLNSSADQPFCLAAKGYPKHFQKNEFVRHIFHTRLSAILSLIDKLDEIQTLNFEDDVTGLFNQRYLNVLLDQEIERFKRSNVSFSILFIDVDHFKMVNDKNGHMVGSQLLKEIGQIIKKSVRAVDFCFRYGGDEFLTVLTSTTTEQATTVADRICKSVRETPFLVNGKMVQVTLSIGVACFPEHAQTKEKILQVADEAMYCGKNLSRNVVYLAS